MRYSPLALLVACTLAGSASYAANTITFDGEITDQTCKLTIDGNDNPTVTLPTLSQKELPELDSVAGETPFILTISECAAPKPGSAKKVNIILNNMQVSPKGHLVNTVNDQSGVAVRLLDDKKNKIDLKNLLKVEMGELDDQGKIPPKTFTAQYVREGEITAGKVNAAVQYELNYL